MPFMKRLIHLLLIFSAANASAQDGFFVQPEGGLGIAKLHGTDVLIGGAQINHAASYIARIAAGYSFHRWEATIGIAWWQTAFSWKDSSSDNLSRTYIVHNTLTFSHILLPVSLAKRIDVGKNLRFHPNAGIEYCYNYPPFLHGTEQYSHNSSQFGKVILDKTSDKPYKKQTICLTAGIKCEYAVTQRISIIAGPEIHYMLQPITNSLPIHVTEERQYAYIFTGGMRWNVGKL
jgi:hypothetical protein